MSIQLNQIVDIDTINADVRRIISEELGVEMQSIGPDTDIVTELGAGASDMDAIKTATDNWFHIKISDENWGKMRRVYDVVHLVDVYLEIKQIEM